MFTFTHKRKVSPKWHNVSQCYLRLLQQCNCFNIEQASAEVSQKTAHILTFFVIFHETDVLLIDKLL